VRRRTPRCRGTLPRAGIGVVLLLLLAGVTPGAAVAQVMERDSVEVTSIEFTGVSAFPGFLLRSSIVTNASRCSNPVLTPFCRVGLGRERHFADARTLGADQVRLRVFYFSRGFRDATVRLDTARVESGLRVRFAIHEGRPVRVSSVGFSETEGLPAELFLALPIRPGDPFSVPQYESTRDTLIGRLRSRGFAHAEVFPHYTIRGDEPYSATVGYDLHPGERTRFGEIEIVGAEQVSPAIVRRMLTFEEGDLYDQGALVRSQRSLFGLEVFRHAEVTALPGEAGDTVVPVRVQVNEGDVHRVRVGAGVSTAEFVSAEARWVSRNFLGGARRLEARGRVTHLGADGLQHAPFFESGRGIYGQVSGSFTLDFAQPWFFSPHQTLRSGVFAERRNLPDVYVRTSQGAWVAVTRMFGTGGSLNVTYRPELTRLESEDGDLIFCVSLLACLASDIQVLREPHWLSPLSVSLVRDRSNSLFAPTRGSVMRVEAEIAGPATGSDFSYMRATAELVDYRMMGGVVLASRLRPGWARALGDGRAALGVHPQKRFFAGGANSVRGFSQFRLGPKLLTIAPDSLRRPAAEGGAGCTAEEIGAGYCSAQPIADRNPGAFEVRPVGGAILLEGNVELRFPVWGELRGAAFVDFGQVWAGAGSVSIADVIATPGAGVRYHSPIGPIRIDLGYNPQGAEQVSVVTEVNGDGMASRLRPQRPVEWTPYRSFLDRVQIHFSIGQAF
jgi:outer membrane protein assembly factor BamA